MGDNTYHAAEDETPRTFDGLVRLPQRRLNSPPIDASWDVVIWCFLTGLALGIALCKLLME
jgi:hypothetical protein